MPGFLDKLPTLPFKRKDREATKATAPVHDSVSDLEKQAVNAKMREVFGDDTGVGDDKLSKLVLASLDKAVGVQSSVITRYVEGVKKRNPQADIATRQAEIDDHFLKIVTGTGATSGAAAAIPGIGFATGAAAVGAESVVFLEAAAWYILASANLRGVNLADKELRRALVLLVLSGSRGTAIVDTLFDEQGEVTQTSARNTVAKLTRFSAPTLQGINSRLTKSFLKQVTKKFKWAWLSKLMPLGIGAVLGGMANRKLARMVMDNAHAQLDSLR